MTFSVVVCHVDAPERLLECLEALRGQAGDVVVVDCSRDDPAPLVEARFPGVRVLRLGAVRTMPEMRAAGVRAVGGDVIGMLEARSIPAADWAVRMTAAHERWPDAAVVGGSVAFPAGGSARDRGMYLAEYADFAPPLAEGAAARVSEANMSFKRAAFAGEGEWESSLPLRRYVVDARVDFRHAGMPTVALCAQRFFYGREYAAKRVRGWLRPLFILGAIPLPLLLTLRHWRRGPLGSLPWLVVFEKFWAAGELVGYLFGSSPRRRVY